MTGRGGKTIAKKGVTKARKSIGTAKKTKAGAVQR